MSLLLQFLSRARRFLFDVRERVTESWPNLSQLATILN
jgi:hypothetical protein